MKEKKKLWRGLMDGHHSSQNGAHSSKEHNKERRTTVDARNASVFVSSFLFFSSSFLSPYSPQSQSTGFLSFLHSALRTLTILTTEHALAVLLHVVRFY